MYSFREDERYEYSGMGWEVGNGEFWGIFGYYIG